MLKKFASTCPRRHARWPSQPRGYSWILLDLSDLLQRLTEVLGLLSSLRRFEWTDTCFLSDAIIESSATSLLVALLRSPVTQVHLDPGGCSSLFSLNSPTRIEAFWNSRVEQLGITNSCFGIDALVPLAVASKMPRLSDLKIAEYYDCQVASSGGTHTSTGAARLDPGLWEGCAELP